MSPDYGDFVLVPSSIRGYRQWRALPQGKLGSIGQNYVWPSASITAECLSYSHNHYSAEPSPAYGCTCGIYATHRPHFPTGRNAHYGDWCDCSTCRFSIYGVIEGTGIVRLGTIGFKAQHAAIQAVVPGNPFVFAQGYHHALEARHPGIKILPNVDDLMSEYPPVDVQELLQKRE